MNELLQELRRRKPANAADVDVGAILAGMVVEGWTVHFTPNHGVVFTRLGTHHYHASHGSLDHLNVIHAAHRALNAEAEEQAAAQQASQPKTVRVRIAVAVNAKGEWSADGFHTWSNDEARDMVFAGDDDERVYFVEADLPVPLATPKTTTIKGKVIQ